MTVGKENRNPKKNESYQESEKPVQKTNILPISEYRKSETMSPSDAKKELKNMYPRIANVSFLCSRVNVLHGWFNFKNPFDCSKTYDEIQTLNPLELNPLELNPLELGPM